MSNRYLHGSVLLLFNLFIAPVIAQDVELHRGCDCPTLRLDDAYCASSAVFEAVALGNDTVHAEMGIKPVARNVIEAIHTRFKVNHVLKGTVDGLVTVRSATRKDDCGYHFRTGEHYLLFVTEEDGMLRTDRCDATRPLESVTPTFVDSLALVQRGKRWEGRVLVDAPCQ